ncbi:hypothetical protein [Mesorhizobium sp. M0142]|uniref:hypothetical protein n=1 Tax=unclassified Mesorhizobium TaxID=325217 RepID=UPI003338D381
MAFVRRRQRRPGTAFRRFGRQYPHEPRRHAGQSFLHGVDRPDVGRRKQGDGGGNGPGDPARCDDRIAVRHLALPRQHALDLNSDGVCKLDLTDGVDAIPSPGHVLIWLFARLFRFARKRVFRTAYRQGV